jgi:hypothetical protein
MQETSQTPARRGAMKVNRGRVLLLGVLAIAVIVIAVLLIAGGGGGDNKPSAVSPTIASGAELRKLASESGHTVYWVGERPGMRTEFERDADGNVYIRYLPATGNPASERNGALTIGSYPVGNAVAGLEVVAKRPGTNLYNLRSSPGSIVVNSDSKPSSVYVAFAHSPVQVEVYDPVAADSLRAVLQGEVEPLR